MPDTTSLYDPPLHKAFTGDRMGRKELQASLDEMYRSTRVVNPGSPREIRFNPMTRKTQAGYRYTSAALSRVCQALAPGLSNVIANVAGPSRQDVGQREMYSTNTACTIFNQIVDLRFDAVLTKGQLVIDEERFVIEGMLGPRTHYLENSTFLELVESALEDCCGAQFAGATLAGRRLFARYLQTELLETPWGAYQRGYAVCATESGDDSIRAYLMYQHVETGNCCLEVPAGGIWRQRRTGSKFMEQIKRLLVKLSMAKSRDLNANLLELDSRKLFPSTDDKTVQVIIGRWRRRFKLAGMSADVAVAATNLLMRIEHGNAGPVSFGYAENFTERDLFNAAMAAAQTRNQRVRETTEHAVFDVFFGDET